MIFYTNILYYILFYFVSNYLLVRGLFVVFKQERESISFYMCNGITLVLNDLTKIHSLQ